MKKVCTLVLLVMILLSSFLVVAQEATGGVEELAETAGVYLLKFQNFLMGALSFISLGAFKQGGVAAFAQFLFMIILFMMFYSIISLFGDRFLFLGSLILTILVFSSLDAEKLRVILLNYEAMGVAITVMLPVLILFAFTFKIYQRAYEGKSEQSPFFAEMFNLVFLVFFGIFFIRYGKSEEGAIAVARFGAGWLLIGLGVAQMLIYKMLAGVFHNWRAGGKDDEEKKMKKMKREASEKIEDAKAEETFSYSKGMRRGGTKSAKKIGSKINRWKYTPKTMVKRKSAERYSKMFGAGKAKERFGS